MIGTVFLWMFWPSFNSAPGLGNTADRYHAVVNTYLALCAACVSTFIWSTIFNPKRRVTMEHVQNATLAGGVAMGTAASMAVQPYGALIVGFVAGLLSTAGYQYIKVSISALLVAIFTIKTFLYKISFKILWNLTPNQFPNFVKFEP